MQKSNQHIFVITGEVHGGKTTFLKDLAEPLRKEKLKIAGFICPGFFEDGERSGFYLLNLADGNDLLFNNLHDKLKKI